VKNTSSTSPLSSFGIAEIGLAFLILYNLIFFLGKFGPEAITSPLAGIFAGVQANKGALTLLELLGTLGVFIDLVIRYDQHVEHPWLRRRLRVIFTGFVILAFFFKVFINYLDSAYLTT
jgi:hypothetical protein